MRHGSLFSGIGGFELAAEWMGWDNIFHCEMNTFGANAIVPQVAYEIFRTIEVFEQQLGAPQA